MLNQTVLTGNLGADPEIFYGSEGQPIASFNLAFRVAKKKTGWIKVVCFNRLASTGIHSLAEITEKHLHKGARIGVIGTLDQQKWQSDEGVTRISFQLIANTVEFIKTDGRGFEGNQQPQDDDIPF
jgi:single-strand DNA-binding protein